MVKVIAAWQSSKGVMIIQLRAADKKAEAEKQSAVDSMKVLPSRL